MLLVSRNGFPLELRDISLAHRESKWYISQEKDMLCVAWRDKKAKKTCVMVSTNATAKLIEVRGRRGNTIKPAIVHAYNKAMNGCDKADQNIALYLSLIHI